MYAWRQIPLLRLLFPFGAGIGCAAFFTPYIIWVLTLLACLLLFVIISHLYLLKHIHKTIHFISSLAMLFAFFGIGITHTYFLNDQNYATHFSKVPRQNYLLARVVSLPAQKEKSVGCLLKVSEVTDSLGEMHKVQGRAQVYLGLDSSSLALKYGDYIVIKAPLREVESPKNPYQFDFKTYYARQNIYQNGYLKAELWKPVGRNKVNPLYAEGYKWQVKLQSIFNTHIQDDQIRGVAQAIVFGYKDDLDEEWLKAFSKTGTIHVLAVSGLHVGIIYLMLSFMFGLGKSKGRSRIVKSALILVILFLYTLVTGLSPSVSRAALMFGTVIVAQAFKRQTNIYNTLSFACLFLLVVNPLNLYNVGFQFSFLAVLSIVYYKDYFRNIWPQANPILNNVNTLVSVSIAAQITTFPLGLYYFHQYPNLFMFSNLIVIPCISIILYLGIAMVISAVLYTPLADLAANVATMYIQFIARTVQYIQDVPYAYFENVHITLGQMGLIYAFMISVTLSLVYKWSSGLVISFVTVICFLAIDYTYQQNHQKGQVVIFDVRNETLIGFKEEGHITFIASKGIYTDPAAFDFIITPYLVNERLTEHYNIVPQEVLALPANYHGVQSLGNGFIWFQNHSYLVLDSYAGYITHPIAVDYLLIGYKKSSSFLGYADKHISSEHTVLLHSWKSKSLNSQLLFNRSRRVSQDGCVVFSTQ
jgi:competence protein ComEC